MILGKLKYGYRFCSKMAKVYFVHYDSNFDNLLTIDAKKREGWVKNLFRNGRSLVHFVH